MVKKSKEIAKEITPEVIHEVAKEVVQPVIQEVIQTVPIVDAGLALYGKLRNEINSGRENFTQQLKQTKDAIDQRLKEIEALKGRALKLEGAIDASEIYLKSALPSNTPK